MMIVISATVKRLASARARRVRQDVPTPSWSVAGINPNMLTRTTPAWVFTLLQVVQFCARACPTKLWEQPK